MSTPNYNILIISCIECKGLKNVVWNGLNDPYVMLSWNDWIVETEVQHEAGADACWKNLDVCAPFENNLQLSIVIMQRNRAREDQIIGKTFIRADDLSSFLNQSQGSHSIQIDLDSPSPRIKANAERYGRVRIEFSFGIGEPSPSTASSKIKLPGEGPTLQSLSSSASHQSAVVESKRKEVVDLGHTKDVEVILDQHTAVKESKSNDSDTSNLKTTVDRSPRSTSNSLSIPINEKDKSKPKAKRQTSMRKTADLEISRVEADQIDSEKMQKIDVIEKARSIAKSKILSLIELYGDEIETVIEALGLSVVSDKSAASISARSELCKISLINPSAFASSINKSLQGKSVDSEIGFNLASTAIKLLQELVIGNWDQAKTFICSQAAGRPATWSLSTVYELMNLLEIPTADRFQMCSGDDFLSIDKRGLTHEFGIKASIMQYRVLFYQKILQLIDEWWIKGIRPNDPSTKLSNSIIHAIPKMEATTVTPKPRRSQSRKSTRSRNSSSWGTSIPKHGKYVEIIETGILLESWTSFNRAYAWNIPVDTLSSLSNRLGGEIGKILADLDTGMKDGNVASEALFEGVKGCRWIKPVKHDVSQCLAAQSALCSSIVRRLPSSDNNTTYAFLVPILCLRAHSMSTSSLISLKPELISLGRIVRIAAYDNLIKHFAAKDWYDRPSDEAIKLMAGMKAEIVSIADLQSRSRVGIRVLKQNIYDAVPLDAIQFISTKKAKLKRKTRLSSTNRESSLTASRSARPTEVIVDIGATRTAPSSTSSSRSAHARPATRLSSSTKGILTKTFNDSRLNLSPQNSERDTLEMKKIDKIAPSPIPPKELRPRPISELLEQDIIPSRGDEHIPDDTSLSSSSTVHAASRRHSASHTSEIESFQPVAVDYSWLNPFKASNRLISTISTANKYEDIDKESLGIRRPQTGSKPIQIQEKSMSINRADKSESKYQSEEEILPDTAGVASWQHNTVATKKAVPIKDLVIKHAQPMFIGSNTVSHRSAVRASNHRMNNYTNADIINYTSSTDHDLLPSRINHDNLTKAFGIEGRGYDPNERSFKSTPSALFIPESEPHTETAPDVRRSFSKKSITKREKSADHAVNELSHPIEVLIYDGLGILGAKASSMGNIHLKQSTSNNKESAHLKTKQVNGRKAEDRNSGTSNDKDRKHMISPIKIQATEYRFQEEVDIKEKPLYSTIKSRPKSATYTYKGKDSSAASLNETTFKRSSDDLGPREDWTTRQRNIYSQEMKRSEKEAMLKERVIERELRRLHRG
jgi:hypothetical protein